MIDLLLKRLREMAIDNALDTNRGLSREFFKEKRIREILKYTDPVTRTDLVRTLKHIENHEQRANSESG